MTQNKKSPVARKKSKARRVSSRRPLRSQPIAFPIVGIGASAGGVEALTQLFSGMPPDTGMAFVVVQHLDPRHASMAAEILSRHTSMSVREAQNGILVEPNHVYVIPPNQMLAIDQGILTLLPRSEARGQYLPIDSFFRSLAQDQKRRAIGVVLSGTASDGSQGLKAIKSEGGLAIAQEPGSAKYDGMPQSAIASGIVDLVLPPARIAQELARFATHPYIAAACEASGQEADRDTGDLEENEPPPGDALRNIFAILRTHTNVDFSNYKHTTLKRRIERRMMVCRSEDIETYARYLLEHPEEVKALYGDILINVTEFFRDPESFRALEDHALSHLVKNRAGDSPIRIWVPGCSSGEEAYSLLMLLLESLGDAAARAPIQIFGTDISEPALQKARSGIYPEIIERNVSKERLRRFFEKVDGGYKIKKSLRELCLFSRHDVVTDPPFAKLDLVSCRNLLIYLGSVLQKRVLPVFHYALKPTGFLWLGKSETPGGFSNLFTTVDKAHKIFSKTNVPTPLTFHFPTSGYMPEPPAVTRPSLIGPKGSSDFLKDADRIVLNKFAPPGVVVNADLEILQFRGRTAAYLESPPGQPSNNLLKMAKPSLQHGLRAAFQESMKRNDSVKKTGLPLREDGAPGTVDIEVCPTNPSAPPKQRTFLVLFEEGEVVPLPVKVKKSARSKAGGNKDRDLRRIAQLEHDLAENIQYQHSMAEEYETTQEELTSANEELQSTNEELQSTNEELETAKEELQSANEELVTVNEELQNRNTELTLLGSDLSYLLNSVEIPIVMVGSDHRIRRFTPKAERAFKLISSDIGRSVGDFKPTFDIDLDALVSEVTKSLTPIEQEVCDREGRWMRLQIRPFRTYDNRIDGAVIALIDIEALKQQAKEAKSAENYLQAISDTVGLPLAVLDDKLRLRSANLAFWEHFKLLKKVTGKDLFVTLEIRGDAVLELKSLLSDVFGGKSEVRNFEAEFEFSRLGLRTMVLSAKNIEWISQGSQESQESHAVLLSFDDVTDQRNIERALKQESKNVHLLELLAAAASEPTDLDETLQFFLDKVCNHAGWAVGCAYLASSDSSGEFTPAKVWHLDDREKFARLKETGQLSKLATAIGLPGRVFATGRPVVISQMHPDDSSLQWKVAEEVGIRAAFAFPVIANKSLVASLVFFSAESRKADAKVLEIIGHGIQKLGRVFERAFYEKQRAYLLNSEREAREEAERSNRAKDIFLAMLSHELRTPLTSILSWAQMLKLGKVEGEKARYGAGVIESSARAQGQLIDDLLDISRITMGKLAIEIREVNPAEEIDAAIESVRTFATSKGIEIKKTFESEVGRIFADPIRVRQIVWNLLTNAIKFSPNGSVIDVGLDRVQDQSVSYARIRVRDYGKGIDLRFLPHVFDSFSQADPTSTRTHGGLGVGLAIVRKLVELQGGTVRAENVENGGGALFTVIFPLISDSKHQLTQTAGEKKQPEAPAEATVTLSLKGLRILFVDDEENTREAIALLLESFGAQVMAVGSTREAVAAFGKFNPSVLVADIAMPGEDGYSLIREVRALGPKSGGNVPAIALTAYATQADAQRTRGAGFQAHIAKPFEAENLARVIVELVRNPVKESSKK